jgi:glutamyl-tRNA(Gln) amidotransferase subunit D
VKVLDKELSGYKGRVAEALQRAGVSVGDNIRITKIGKVYEGVLFPRSEYADDKHIVIKLRNGYNIGIECTDDTVIQFISRGEKPRFTSAPTPEERPELPRVSVISTGGTIASRVDYRTGAVQPALTAEDLHCFVPEISNIARIEAKVLCSEFSENIGPSHWKEMAYAALTELKKGVEGVVFSHGTDTMGYTAAALSFALRDLSSPVVFVGAQRSSDRPSSDAALNLIAATTIGARAPFAEVVVAMHQSSSDEYVSIHRGTRVRKCHTSARDAFKSVDPKPLGRLNLKSLELDVLSETLQERNQSRDVKVMAKFEEKVALLKFHPNFNHNIIDWYREEGYRGVVLEGTGLGHVGRSCFESLKRAIDAGMLVCMTSQCIWGSVNMNVYETGRDLLALGVIPLGDMISETAYVKLMWVLGQTSDIAEAKEMMLTNMAGEFSRKRILRE